MVALCPHLMFHGGVIEEYHALGYWAQLVVRLLLVLIVGYVAMKFGKGILMSGIRASKRVDATLEHFFSSVINTAGWIIIVVVALLSLGVPATALAGLLAAGGFVIGFAMQDTLGNLAAGVVLLLNRPFNVGEGVTVEGQEGVVDELGIAMTRLKTWDGRMVTIPNGTVLGGPILNWSRNATRRCDIFIGIRYEDDIDAGTRALLEVANADEQVLQDPTPEVLVWELGDSAVNLWLRAWVPTPEWITTKARLTHQCKLGVEAAGCTIPFPQRDVHMYPTERIPIETVQVRTDGR